MTGRDPDRIGPVLDALRDAWERHPDWRLGQLVYNAADITAGDGQIPPCAPLFHMEDEVLLDGLDRVRGP